MSDRYDIDPNAGPEDRLLIYAVAEWFLVMSRNYENDEAIKIGVCMIEALEDLIMDTAPTSVTGINAKTAWMIVPVNFARYGETTDRFDELRNPPQDLGHATSQ